MDGIENRIPADMGVTTVSDFRFSYSKTDVPGATTLHHYHDACEIVFFLKADLQIFIKDTRYNIRDGDMFYMDEYDIHRIHYKPTSQYERYVVNFRRSILQPVLEAIGAPHLLDLLADSPDRCLHLTIRQRIEMQQFFEGMQKCCADGHEQPVPAARGEVLALLTLILLRIRQQMKNAPKMHCLSERDKLIQSIVQHLDQHFRDAIRLDTLAATFYLDKYHLSHLFKRKTGFSIIEYVQHRRIIEAQKKLMNPKIDIIDIYLDCGFSNAQHFHRIFKRLSGMTPNQYRKLHTRDTSGT
jgi:AraC-like DNA-binding protein